MDLCESYLQGDVWIGGNNSVVISEDLKIIRMIESVTKQIARSSDELFFKTKLGRRGLETLAYSQLGKRLLNSLNLDIFSAVAQFPLCKLNPYVEAFIESTRSLWGGWGESDIRRLSVEDAISTLNSAVRSIRKIASSNDFKRELAKCQRSSNKNWRSLNNYITLLFGEYPRLLAVRVDFHFSEEANAKIGYGEAKGYLKRYIAAMKTNPIFRSKVGYAWKMEYGLDRGYHVHFVFFMNGAEVREDVTFGKMFGELWKQKITEGKGTYHNCNAWKSKYRQLGIGMIHRGDTERREALLHAVHYLVKNDYYLYFDKTKTGKNFSTGEVPKNRKSKPKSKKGKG